MSCAGRMLKVLKDRLLEIHEKPAQSLLSVRFANANLVILDPGAQDRGCWRWT